MKYLVSNVDAVSFVFKYMYMIPLVLVQCL